MTKKIGISDARFSIANFKADVKKAALLRAAEILSCLAEEEASARSLRGRRLQLTRDKVLLICLSDQLSH